MSKKELSLTSNPTAIRQAPPRVPPYGIIQFASFYQGNEDLWQFMLRAHVNLCESRVSTPVSEAWGWGDRKPFEAAMAAARLHVEAAHKVGVKAMAYVGYHPIYGDAVKRTGIFEFYDRRWNQYEDYLGPRPPDPVEWTMRDTAGKPMPFTFREWHGYYICMNNPYWLQFLNGCLHLLVDCGVDGVRYDGPGGGLCWCRFCRDAFARWLGTTYSPQELSEHFHVADLAGVKIPTASDDPLQFPLRRFTLFRQGQTVAETGAFARQFNPHFIMSYNYCIWGADIPGSNCNEDLAAAGDYGLIEGCWDATAHSEGGRKHSAGADCKFLLASSDNKPMTLHYYLYPCGAQLEPEYIVPWPQEKVEGNALFYPAAMAEGMAGGCPYPIMCFHHINARHAILAYADFFHRQRPCLTEAQTYANVAVLASIGQTCAALPSYPMAISRFLADQHVPHAIILDRDLTPERLQSYDAIVLPEIRLLSDRQSRNLAAFAKRGGGLVAFGPVGTHNQYNEERATSSLAEVFDISGKDFPVHPFRHEIDHGRVAWFPSARLPGTGRWPLPADGLKDLEGVIPALRWAAGGRFSGSLEASAMVELNLMHSPDGKLLLAHLLNYNVAAPATLTPYDNLRLELLLPDDIAPGRVTLFSPDLPLERNELPFRIERRAGRCFLQVDVPRIEIYNLVVVELPGARLAAPPADAVPPMHFAVRGPSLASPGQKLTLTATFANRTSASAEGLALEAAAPEGWKVEPISVSVGALASGRARSTEFVVTIPDDAPVGKPSDVSVSAAFALPGNPLNKMPTVHRVLVRKPLEMSLVIAEQPDPVTRRMGLALRATNISTAACKGEVVLRLPGDWQTERERSALAVPGGALATVPLVVTLPVATAKADLRANVSYQSAGNSYHEEVVYPFDMQGNFLLIRCPRITTAPNLDGTLGDPCWSQAVKVADFQRTDGSGRATDQTEGYVMRDDIYLYVGLRCHEALISLLAARSRGDGPAVREDDSVEIWFDPQHKHERWLQFMANCVGARHTAPTLGVAWRVVTGRHADAWTLECAIPFASLEGSPKAGDLWGFHVCRTRPAKGLAQAERSSWACTQGGFQQVESFGHMTF